MATVSAKVTYPCPPPFDRSQYPAADCNASISLPEGISLVDGPGSSTVILGEIAAGTSVSTSWRVRADGPVSGKAVTVTAQGNVSGSVPEVRWTGDNVVYPPYFAIFHYASPYRCQQSHNSIADQCSCYHIAWIVNVWHSSLDIFNRPVEPPSSRPHYLRVIDLPELRACSHLLNRCRQLSCGLHRPRTCRVDDYLLF